MGKCLTRDARAHVGPVTHGTCRRGRPTDELLEGTHQTWTQALDVETMTSRSAAPTTVRAARLAAAARDSGAVSLGRSESSRPLPVERRRALWSQSTTR